MPDSLPFVCINMPLSFSSVVSTTLKGQFYEFVTTKSNFKVI